MTFSDELAAMFRRDLTRVVEELQAFPDEELLWQVVPGVSNSAGNLTLHLEGNLREFIGRQLGGVAYQRIRPAEFSTIGMARAEMIQRIEEVRELVARIVAGLRAEDLAAQFPEQAVKASLSSRQYLMHLYGHLSYHLGQIDYLRRVLTGGTAIDFAGL